jgi:hypothetical protein
MEIELNEQFKKAIELMEILISMFL